MSTPLPVVNGPSRTVQGCTICLLVIVPFLISPGSYRPYLWSKLIGVQLIALLMTVSLGFYLWRSEHERARFNLDLPILAYLILHFLSIPFALNSNKTLIEVIKLTVFSVLYFAVSRGIRLEALIAWSRLSLWTAGAVSAIGVWQYLGLGFHWLPSGGYPSSTFLYRNFAAMYLIMVLPLAGLSVLLAKGWKWEALSALLIALPLTFLIYTRTRGAWVGLLASLVLISVAAAVAYRTIAKAAMRQVLDQVTWRKTVIWFGSLAIVVFLSVLPASMFASSSEEGQTLAAGDAIPSRKRALSDAVTSIFEGQDSGRIGFWKHSLELIRDHPFWGVGLGNWELVYPTYSGGENVRPGRAVLRPHNDYVWIASELGLIGLGVFLWIVIRGLRTAWRELLAAEDPVNAAGILAISASFLAILGHSFFSFPRERIVPSMLFWMLLGVIAAAGKRPMEEVARSPFRRILVPVALMMITLLGLPLSAKAFMADRAQYQTVRSIVLRDWSRAKEWAGRSISWGVYDYRILLKKAQACEYLGEREVALRASQWCLEYHPNSLAAYTNIGKLQTALGRLEQAKDAFKRAIELDPDNFVLRRDLGVVYRRLNLTDEAMESYQKALEINPRDGVLRLNLGSLHRSQGDFENAAHELEFAVQYAPTLTEAQIAFGEISQELGRNKEAIRAYEAAIEINPNLAAQPYLNLGNLYLVDGNLDRSEWAYRKFLDRWKGEKALREQALIRLKIIDEHRKMER